MTEKTTKKHLTLGSPQSGEDFLPGLVLVVVWTLVMRRAITSLYVSEVGPAKFEAHCALASVAQHPRFAVHFHRPFAGALLAVGVLVSGCRSFKHPELGCLQTRKENRKSHKIMRKTSNNFGCVSFDLSIPQKWISDSIFGIFLSGLSGWEWGLGPVSGWWASSSAWFCLLQTSFWVRPPRWLTSLVTQLCCAKTWRSCFLVGIADVRELWDNDLQKFALAHFESFFGVIYIHIYKIIYIILSFRGSVSWMHNSSPFITIQHPTSRLYPLISSGPLASQQVTPHKSQAQSGVQMTRTG